MGETFTAGVAFIVEGPTEEEFYKRYIVWACERHPGFFFAEARDNGEVCYRVSNGVSSTLVKFMSMNSVSSIPSSAAWFLRSCVARHPRIPWEVFLAYDTDGHEGVICQAKPGDWTALRSTIGAEARSVTDLAAETDIEDVMLLDLKGVLMFLGLPEDTPVPIGGKGKSKMRRLFRQVSVKNAYHEGSKAKPLIRALNMETIATRAGIPFASIENALFSSNHPRGQ